MGYYSNFEVASNDGLFEEVHEDGILLLSKYIGFREVKWYAMEEDMKTYSKQYPDVLFSVFQEGEENGHLVKYYFKNGKMQKCPAKIIYDEFDESKLN